MSHNLVKEAHELFHIPPAPKELDFDSRAEYLVTKAEHDKSHEQQAMAREHWIEREKVLELEWETERMRLELERKKKEEEEKEKEKKLAKAAKKKATAVVKVLIDDCQGCDTCLWVSKSSFASCESGVDMVIIHPMQWEGNRSLEPRIWRFPSVSSDSILTSTHSILTHFESYHFSFYLYSKFPIFPLPNPFPIHFYSSSDPLYTKPTPHSMPYPGLAKAGSAIPKSSN